MSDLITTALIKGFRANIQILSQQMDTRLRYAVREESLTGEDDYFEQLGAVDGAFITSRHSDVNFVSTPHYRRKVTAVPWYISDLIDKADKVRMLADPTSPYVRNFAASANRAMDLLLIQAAFGSAWTGKTGTTEVVFPTGTNVVAVDLGGSAEGLTINKLLAARERIYGYDVDETIPLHICVTQTQITDLLKTTQATSSDYNSVKSLVRGEIDTFLGLKFHRSQQLEVDANSYRRIIVWAEDGLLLGVHQDMTTKITPRADKHYSTQVYLRQDMGATRMEEEKVVEIKCSEA